MKLLPDWSFVTKPSAYAMRSYGLPLNKMLDLWVRFACWPFWSVPSQSFRQECLIEMSESVWVPFPLLFLFFIFLFCQLAYLQYWFLCFTHSRLASCQSRSFYVFHGFIKWVVGFSAAQKYALACSTFCLVWIDGSLTWTAWSRCVCVCLSVSQYDFPPPPPIPPPPPPPRSALCPGLADFSDIKYFIRASPFLMTVSTTLWYSVKSVVKYPIISALFGHTHFSPLYVLAGWLSRCSS